MNKSELISILQKRKQRSERSKNRFYFIELPLLIILLLVVAWFEPFGQVNSGILYGEKLVFVLFFIYWFVKETWFKFSEKVYCENCTAEQKEHMLAYSVAVNECENCKMPIYET